MNDARLYVLIGRKLSGEATVEELEELEQLLRQHPVQPYMLEMLQEIWAKKGKHPEGSLLDEKWERLSTRLDHKEQATFPRKRSLWPKIAVAASILGLIWMALGGYRFLRPENTVQASRQEQEDTVIIARYGEKRKIVLPDSTRVHLNSGSQLTYRKHFGQRERQIWLNGEAYFDVTANAQHPFLVHTGRMTIRVLGTAFNVKAYNTLEDEETTVVEGKVEVSLKEGEEKKVILLPNEKISLKHNDLPAKTADVHVIQYEVSTVRPGANNDDMPREALWMQEKMSFTDEPFEMVALGMERWYNVKIHFGNEKIKGMRMNGDFHNISIEEAMKILQMMTPFSYEITGNDIYIR